MTRLLPLKNAPLPRHAESATALAAAYRVAYSGLIMFDRIKIDPRVCEGKATIRGIRITVEFVLKLLGEGLTPQEIIDDYPLLELEDIYEAARYGAWLASDRTIAIS